jgi:hypothetical protein
MPADDDRPTPGHRDGIANGRNNRVLALLGVVVLLLLVLGTMAVIGDWKL